MENSKPKLGNRRVYDLHKHKKMPVSENPNLIRATDGQVARNVPRVEAPLVQRLVRNRSS
jgi:hypothetical protein